MDSGGKDHPVGRQKSHQLLNHHTIAITTVTANFTLNHLHSNSINRIFRSVFFTHDFGSRRRFETSYFLTIFTISSFQTRSFWCRHDNVSIQIWPSLYPGSEQGIVAHVEGIRSHVGRLTSSRLPRIYPTFT